MTTERASNTDRLMEEINALGVGTPEYHEGLWMLFSILARRQGILAEHARLSRRKRERAAETRQRNRAGV